MNKTVKAVVAKAAVTGALALPPGIETRRISVTPANAPEARALVQRWPALGGLVASLQAQGVFPGLRALTVTLTGPAEYVDGGLGAVMPQNAPQGVLSGAGEKP